MIAAVCAATVLGAAARAAGDPRVAARSGGGDRATAERIAAALLVRPLPAQLAHVRCERLGDASFCGLAIEANKLRPPVGEPGFLAEVRTLVRGAFAAAPSAAEIDLWATVPIDAGRGAVVSGDLAVPTSRNVFTLTVPRSALPRLDARLAGTRAVYWDPSFRAALRAHR